MLAFRRLFGTGALDRRSRMRAIWLLGSKILIDDFKTIGLKTPKVRNSYTSKFEEIDFNSIIFDKLESINNCFVFVTISHQNLVFGGIKSTRHRDIYIHVLGIGSLKKFIIHSFRIILVIKITDTSNISVVTDSTGYWCCFTI